MLQRLAVRLLLVVLAAGCAGAPAPAAPTRDAVLVVGSFDFPESALVAEVYAQALEAAGVPVRRELDLGPRELVLPALRQGLLDVVPEYLGTALATVRPGSSAPASSAAGRDELAAALRGDRLHVLTPSPAQNTNGLAVTQATARRLGLRTTSGLRPYAGRLVLAGPPECTHRPACLPGLRSRYGLAFRQFVPYATESQRITALEQGVVDVSVVFTTDGLLAEHELVLLADDRHLQPPEHLVPVVSDRALSRYDGRVTRVLDGVDRRLDTAELTFLNWRLTVAGKSVHDEARGWLLRHGLVRR